MKLYEEQELIHSSEITKRRLGINDSLTHHGILGQMWGIRRFQDKNGHLTEAGKKRYYENYSEGTLSKRGEKLKSHAERLSYTPKSDIKALPAVLRPLAYYDKGLGSALGVERSEAENNFLEEYKQRKMVGDFIKKEKEVKEKCDAMNNSEEYQKTKQTLEKEGYKVNEDMGGDFCTKTVNSKHGKLTYNVQNPDVDKGYLETNDNLKAIKKFDSNRDDNIEKLWSKFMKDVHDDEKKYGDTYFSEGLNINLDKGVGTYGDKVDRVYFSTKKGFFTIELDKDGNYLFYTWDD